MIHTGDCVEVMASMDEASVDAIVCDPPYSIGFMSKPWDIQHEHGPWATAALRVAKPGAYLLAFGGTRTVHRLTVALEDAGWIIRDVLCWVYASGFPKSKASLKPAWEPIVLARKPGPLRELGIDAARIGTTPPPSVPQPDFTSVNGRTTHLDANRRNGEMSAAPARWPANVVLTAPAFDGGWAGVVGGGEVKAGVAVNRNRPEPTLTFEPTSYGWPQGRGPDVTYGDTGTYSRFFLVPKSSRSDREPLLYPDDHERGKRFSTHPTVKPTELMRHLVRLVTPPGGTVLDPFAGSGSTLLAAEQEGFPWVGIEREPEYVRIAEQRLVACQRGLGLAG